MQRKKKVIIVGGGAAGWFTAGYLIQRLPNFDVTVIESPNIPQIGVGESVTPHVQMFFDELGIPTNKWMQETGAIYKLANKFEGWVTGDPKEIEYFSFNFPFDTKQLFKENSDHFTYEKGLSIDPDGYKTCDMMSHLYNSKDIDRFDKYFNSQYHYMEKNVAPFNKKEYLLNPWYSWAQHINAEKCGDYVRKNIAEPNGVRHVKQKIVEVLGSGERISSLKLENGQTITGDIFVDASGFRKVLTRSLGWEEHNYTDYAVDSAVVCPSSYEDPETEMLNHTTTVAQPHGWQFKVSLYHRMGNGYVYSGNHISDDQAVDHFKKITKNRRVSDPRIIKWTPSTQKVFGAGNVAVVGLSAGFYEPLEANSLFIATVSIKSLVDTLKSYEENSILDWKHFNDKLSYATQDIVDFIRVHYTLSKRTDTDFWKDMKAIGERKNDVDLLRQKYFDNKSSMVGGAADGWTMYPDYMWLQLAIAWGIDTSSWFDKKADQATLDISRTYFLTREQRHATVSKYMTNNYQWLKEHVFNGVNHKDWEIRHYGINFDSKKSQ
jgi:tryptophan halogenase